MTIEQKLSALRGNYIWFSAFSAILRSRGTISLNFNFLTDILSLQDGLFNLRLESPFYTKPPGISQTFGDVPVAGSLQTLLPRPAPERPNITTTSTSITDVAGDSGTSQEEMAIGDTSEDDAVCDSRSLKHF